MDDNETVAEPPQTLADIAREHPGLVLAGGLLAGLVVGALIPRRTGSRLLRNAASVAAVAGELAVVFGEQARERAGETREKLADLTEKAGDATRRAARAGRERGHDARDAGLKLARKAVDSVAGLRK